MRIGKLRDLVTVEKPGTTLDDFGQVTAASWTTVATVWANLMPVGGRESVRAGAVGSTLSMTILVRYQDDLMPPQTTDAWRIRAGSRLFNIIAANPDYKKSHIIFDCSEGSLDGQ